LSLARFCWRGVSGLPATKKNPDRWGRGFSGWSLANDYS
jgi:hypothetical protein